MDTVQQKVFLSHASEDKARFVVKFAEALVRNGVDVWLDRWEMLPGDGLIQKIFEEGLKKASAVIVVLSRHSVAKPWVREELDVAAVNRINRGSKLIPVILDDCEVPEVLQATLWERVPDLSDIGPAVERVTAAILGHRSKPPVGSAPVYTAPAYASFPGLASIDGYVLFTAAEWTIDRDEHFVDPTEMFLKAEPPVIAKDLLSDSIDILENEHYVNVSRHLGPGPYSFQVTEWGLELYLANHFPNYDAVVRGVMALLANDEMKASDKIALRLGAPHRVVKHIFNRLDADGDVMLSKSLSAVVHVIEVAASLRRKLAA
jgi:hypothetical protein